MSSESGERRPARGGGNGTKPSEPEHLPCPRCDSTNTKFCYYNNYNLSQPRHFCKSCRRYWTQGGTLRNIPVGGGTRKPTHKRPRIATSATSTATTSSSSSTTATTNAPEILNSVPVSMISEMGHGPDSSGPLLGCEVNLNEALPETGSFSSLLTTHVGNGGFMNIHPGYGIGIGPGMHGMGFGLGMLDWPMQPIAQGHGGDGGGSTGGGGGNAGWQIGGVEGGLSDGDCFGWPELAISTPGKALK